MSEEYKSKYATDVKKLRFNGLLDRAFFGEDVVKEAWRMIYNNEVVFNRAFFELWSKNTIELEAVGTREEPLYKVLDVVSRKKDYDGLITEVVFEGADEVIEPNTTNTEKSGTFTIRQRYSNLEIVGTWTQKKDEVKDIEYQYVESVDVAYDGELPATQSLVNPRVTIYYVVKKYYSSNEIKTETLKTNGVVTYAKGQVQNSSGAYIDTSNGDVYSINLGKNPSPHQEAYVVNEMSGIFQVTDKNGTNSYDWTWTGNHFIKQSANEKRNNGVAYYDFDPTLSTYRITGDANDIYVKANAFYIQPTIWTSLVEDRDISKTFADLSVSDGTLDNYRIEGGNETTWHITKNGESARRVSITFSNSLDGYNNTLYVDQDAYSEEVTWGVPFMNGSITWVIPASGASTQFTIPLKQYKYKGESVEGIYEWDAVVTYVEGYSQNGNASFSSGNISCDSMGTISYPSGRVVFEASRIKARGQNGVEYEIEIPDSILSISQGVNKVESRREDYHINNDVPLKNTTIEGESRDIIVTISATYDVVEVWTSKAEASGTFNLPIYISAPDCEPQSTSASGKTSVTLQVRKNETGASRTISVRLYNDDANKYSETFTLTQKAYVEQEVWMHPQLEGSVSIGEIPASGSATDINATITQNKMKGGTVIETRTLSIIGIVGTQASGVSVLFSNGAISATSMGTTEYKTGRKVYDLTKLKVRGADEVDYEVPLPSTLEILQAKNVKEENGYGIYKLSVSASPSSGISENGGTSTITSSAQIEQKYIWSSGSPADSEYKNSNGNLAVTPTGLATISPDSIMGTNQKSTLNINVKNTTTKPRVFTVSLSVGNSSTSCTVTQNKSSYPIDVWMSNGQIVEDNKWYLGKVDTGSTGVGGYPVSHIVVATTSAYKNNAAQINANFTYQYRTSSGVSSATYNNRIDYVAGSEITINGQTYYGVILAENLTDVQVGNVTTFSVMGGGDIT